MVPKERADLRAYRQRLFELLRLHALGKRPAQPAFMP